MLLAGALLACGGKSAEQAAVEDVYANATEQIKNLQEGTTERPALTREDLEAMVPETLLGLARTSLSANQTGAMGFTMSTATAEFKNEDSSRRISLSITDGMGGNLPGMSLVNSMTVDQKEGTRITKTTSIDGQKAILTWDSETKDGDLTVIFPQSLLKLEGNDLDAAKDLGDAYGELSLGKLK